MNSIDKSALFIAFNAARKVAHQGGLDIARVNRGLGLAQSKAGADCYGATADHCDCPDSHYRAPVVCKHRIASALRAFAVADVAQAA